MRKIIVLNFIIHKKWAKSCFLWFSLMLLSALTEIPESYKEHRSSVSSSIIREKEIFSTNFKFLSEIINKKNHLLQDFQHFRDLNQTKVKLWCLEISPQQSKLFYKKQSGFFCTQEGWAGGSFGVPIPGVVQGTTGLCSG